MALYCQRQKGSETCHQVKSVVNYFIARKIAKRIIYPTLFLLDHIYSINLSQHLWSPWRFKKYSKRPQRGSHYLLPLGRTQSTLFYIKISLVKYCSYWYRSCYYYKTRSLYISSSFFFVLVVPDLFLDLLCFLFSSSLLGSSSQQGRERRMMLIPPAESLFLQPHILVSVSRVTSTL